MPDLAVAHACILSLALLTRFTLSPSVDVFYAFRMIQTALMGQYVLLHPKANSKLQALLKGTPFRRIFFCTSWDDLKVALQYFKDSNAVYVRFSHIANFQPKFYVGSTSSFVLDREHSRYRKFLQVQQNKFVLAEVALRFWCRYDNFWMWSILPIYTKKSNFWALEQALIQLWLRLSISFSTAERASFLVPSFPVHANLAPFHYGANSDGSQPLYKSDELFTVQYLVAEFNFGKSFKIWVATLSNASTWKNDSVPTKLAYKDATSFDVLPTTWANLNDPMPSTPSTEP